MRTLVRMLLIGLFVLNVSGCGAYLYDQPKIYGINDYIWWHLSQRQREIVSANQTSSTTYSLNRRGFADCMNRCVPKDGSDATGVTHKCFRKCLKKLTHVPRTYHSTIPF